jgi:hypothetical protein
VAEAPKNTDPKNTDPKVEQKSTGRQLAPAGQSGDPVVQRLLAMRDGHLQTAEAEPPDVAERRKAARDAIADIDRQLADLGFTAQ